MASCSPKLLNSSQIFAGGRTCGGHFHPFFRYSSEALDTLDVGSKRITLKSKGISICQLCFASFGSFSAKGQRRSVSEELAIAVLHTFLLHCALDFA